MCRVVCFAELDTIRVDVILVWSLKTLVKHKLTLVPDYRWI